jgi:polysaccharide export outer membrane protein
MKGLTLLRSAMLLLCVCILATSCSKKNRLLLPNEKVRKGNPVYIINANDSSQKFDYHRLEAGDKIVLNFLNNYDLQTLSFMSENRGGTIESFQLDKDGIVKLPLIGEIKLKGLNRFEASRRLEKEYVKFINNPLIEVTVVNVEVDVFGEVGRQGKYFFEKDKTTIIEVPALGGRFGKKASKKNFRIIRGDPKDPEMIIIELRKNDALQSYGLVMRDHDIIIVDTRSLYMNIDEISAYTALLQPVLILTNVLLIIYTLSN